VVQTSWSGGCWWAVKTTQERYKDKLEQRLLVIANDEGY